MVVNKFDLLALKPIIDMIPCKVLHNGVSHGLSEAGYDIRIKQDIKFMPNYTRAVIHITEPEHDRHTQYQDRTGRFVLASAIEEFQMPPNLVGIVHDKSTWARKGLSVFNTVIEPNWHGFLTLELVYHGYEDLHIPAGSGIAQVIFHQLTENAYYNGKYQNQEDKPVEAKHG